MVRIRWRRSNTRPEAGAGWTRRLRAPVSVCVKHPGRVPYADRAPFRHPAAACRPPAVDNGRMPSSRARRSLFQRCTPFLVNARASRLSTDTLNLRRPRGLLESNAARLGEIHRATLIRYGLLDIPDQTSPDLTMPACPADLHQTHQTHQASPGSQTPGVTCANQLLVDGPRACLLLVQARYSRNPGTQVRRASVFLA